MEQTIIPASEFNTKQYLQVPDTSNAEINNRLKAIPGSFFSNSHQCWFIPSNDGTEASIRSIVGHEEADTRSEQKGGADEVYRSSWRNISPLSTSVTHKFRLPKSAKYRCMLRLLYSHDLSISQLCSIELAHICWGGDTVEIRIPDDPSVSLSLCRVAQQMLAEYIQQTQPEKFLFETQPGQAYSGEKLHRCLVSYMPVQ